MRSRVPEPHTADDVAAAEVAAEQVFVDTVYVRLEEAAKQAQALAREGHARGRLGHEGGLVERDAMVFQAAKRIATLDAAHEGLVFGRLDLLDGDARYIGRLGLRDAQRDVLLIDWRAPAAGLFYRATAQEPAGVVRRRVLRSRGRTVVGVEDDLLDGENAPDDMVVVGEGALLAQISRARDARMHSVVATIQKEQDEAIRAPSRGVTIIGGGPGTGKTVVALHRAAYLLYVDRRRFESGGVLVVGPSDVFMNYIERVLPSLGETAVTLRSLGEVVDGVVAQRHDPAAAAAVKGSARMARVLGRVVRDEAPGDPGELRWFYRDDRLVLSRRELRQLRRQLLSNGQKRNRARPKVERAVVDALWRQVSGERGRERGRDTFVAELSEDDRLTAFVEAWWPPLDAVQVWRWLRDPQRMSRWADGVLSPAEVAALLDSWAHSDTPSIQDVPLIDELRYLLGDVPADQDATRRGEVEGVSADMNRLLGDTPKQLMSFEESGQQRSTQRTEDDMYAHVLVDEAQDLSPMQWRMLGRRGRHASWTVVGDPAQSSWPTPDEAADARAEALHGKDEHRFRLSTNYRNSAEIFDFAAGVALLASADPDLPHAVRRTGIEPDHRTLDDLAAAVRDATKELLDAVAGSIAVVAPVARHDDVAAWLNGVDPRVRVLDALDTKGLEFDAVVIVEPGDIAGESETGWRTLYVVLTRATQRLITLATDDTWLRHVRDRARPAAQR
jgi:DNA helicase IV